MAEDFSRKTIILLVLITVIISLLGTWTIIHEVNNIRVAQPAEEPIGSGKVGVTIMKEPTQPSADSSGLVGFAILEPEEAE